MPTSSERPSTADGLRDGIRRLTDFAREYTEGLGPSEIERLFRRDAPEAFRTLGGEQRAEPAGGLEGFLHATRRTFLGLSYRLAPSRRFVFAIAIACAASGLVFDLDLLARQIPFDLSLVLLLSSIGLLVLILALELVDRVRVRDEIEVARELQQQLLPQRSPEIPGWSFAHSYRTANDIGGDYYDFLPTDDGRYLLVAGDASGHGLAAGLLMVIANTVLRLAVDLDPEPRTVARLLNRVLADTGGRRAFMTVFLGLLDPASGTMDWIGAGHPFPILRRANGVLEELGDGALPLGIHADSSFASGSSTLEPGDLLVLYSDGLPEAVAESVGHSFGFDRLGDLVRPGGSPRQIHDRIVDAFAAFLGDDRPTDDVSLVVIGREPSPR